MLNLDYFQKQISDSNTKSFQMFKELITNNYLNQPKIFCDEYQVDLISKIPIFHSYYINHSFAKNLILTDYDQIDYIKYFHHQDYIIVYNPGIHDIDKYKDTSYKFISMEDNIIQYLKDNFNDQI
jgi:hypothetical protein